MLLSRFRPAVALLAFVAWPTLVSSCGNDVALDPGQQPVARTGTPALDQRTVLDGNHPSLPGARVTMDGLQPQATATGSSVTVVEDTNTAITLTGGTNTNSFLQFRILSRPTRGTISGLPPDAPLPAVITGTAGAPTATTILTYIPNPDANGADSFTFDTVEADTTPGSAGIVSAAATVNISITPVNDPPVVIPVGTTTIEDTAVALDLGVTDVDNAINTLTFTINNAPAQGTLSGTAPNLVYTPNANATGADSFSFSVFDGTTTVGPNFLNITITPQNDAPFAPDVAITTDEDTNVPLNLGFFDVDGDALTFVLQSGFSLGTVTGVPPNLIYAPNRDVSGTDTLVYTVRDPQSTTSRTATATVTINAVNDAPVANPQTITLNEDGTASITLDGTDVDTAVGDLAFTIRQQPGLGTLSGTGRTRTYTPNANANGVDTFTWTVSDGPTTSAETVVTINIAAQNDAPVPAAQSVTTAEDTPLPIVLSATDVDFDALTFAITSGPTNGVLSGAAPNVVYTPNADFNGSDSFVFSASDGTLTRTATVSITITAVNDPPVVNAVVDTATEDTPAELVLSADDVDNATLAFVAQNAAGATLALSNGQAGTLATDGGGRISVLTVAGRSVRLRYAPGANFNGADTFTFTVADGAAPNGVTVGPTNVTINVAAQNDRPDALSGTITTNEDTAVGLDLANADPLGVIFARDVETTNANLTYRIVQGPTRGTLVVDPNAAANQPGRFVYTPNANVNGTDSLTFTVSDGALTSDPATVTFAIAAINDGPTSDNLALNVVEDVPLDILLDGVDVDSANLTFQVQQAAPGTGTLNVTNGQAATLTTGAGTVSVRSVTSTSATVRYTPNANSVLADTFSFTVSDGAIVAGPFFVALTIVPVNDRPTANDTTVTTAEDTPLVINLNPLINDVDANTTLTITVVNPPRGNVDLTNIALGQFTYIPDADRNGADTFTYVVNDGSLTDSGTITVNVTPVNDAPIPDVINIIAGRNASTNPQAPTPSSITPIRLTGSDVDGDALTFVVTSQPGLGTLTGTAPNLTYTPLVNAAGADTFTFTVSDRTAAPVTGTVRISVQATNIGPTLTATPMTTTEDTPFNFTINTTNSCAPPAFCVVAFDPDVDANGNPDPLTFTLVRAPARGVLTGQLNPGAGLTANLLYTPNADEFTTTTPDDFVLRVTDGAVSADVTVPVTITPVNDAPVALNRIETAVEDTDVELELAADDVDNATLTLAAQTGAPGANPAAIALTNLGANMQTDFGGRITVVAVNSRSVRVRYRGAPNFNGVDGFTYTASDGALTSDPRTVVINVAAQNDRPESIDGALAVNEDTVLGIDLASTDQNGVGIFARDVETQNPQLTYRIVQGPRRGVLAADPAALANQPGRLLYTPNANANGVDTITFTVSDGALTSDPATVTINVAAINDAPTSDNVGVTAIEDTSLDIVIDAADVDTQRLDFVLQQNVVQGQPAQPATLAATQANVTSGATLTTTLGVARVVAVADQAITVRYTPNADVITQANQVDVLTFTVSDRTAAVVGPFVVAVTITPVNDRPTAADVTLTTQEDTPIINFNLGASVNDVDLGDTLTITVTQPPRGTVANANGIITYTPDLNANGGDTFSYTVSDGRLTATANVNVGVTPVNDTPVPDAIAVLATGATTVRLTATDVDNGPGELQFVVGNLPGTPLVLNNGVLTGTPPNLTYTPNAGVTNAVDTFAFTVSDPETRATPTPSNPNARITIRQANTAPTWTVQAMTTLEDTPLAFLLRSFGTCGAIDPNNPCQLASDIDVDVNGTPDTLTFTLVTPPARGVLREDVVVTQGPPAVVRGTDLIAGRALTVPNGIANLTYTPNDNVNNDNRAPTAGPDTFVLRVSDGLVSVDQTFVVNITPVNDVPVAIAQDVVTDENSPSAPSPPSSVTIDLNGTDVETATDNLVFEITQPPAFGAVVRNGRRVVYTPNLNANVDTVGQDLFTFTVRDANNATSTPVNVAITVRPINDRPVASNGAVTTTEDTAVGIDLSNTDPLGGSIVASDVETPNGQLRYAIVNGPTRGTLTGVAPNLLYTPNANVNGTDSFTFRISDGLLDSDVRTFTINVTAVNDAPVGEPQDVVTNEDTARTFTLVARDVDDNAQSFTIFGGTNQTPLQLTIAAVGQTIRTSNGVLAVTSLDASSATLNNVTTRTATLGLRFTPDLDFNGLDGFVYAVTDGVVALGNAALVPVNITVNAVNDAPTVQDITVRTDEDTSVALGGLLLAAINDVDLGDNLTFTITNPPRGRLDSNQLPVINYFPDPDVNERLPCAAGQTCADVFTYTISDGRLSATGTIRVNVTPVNDPPVPDLIQVVAARNVSADPQNPTAASRTPIVLTAVDVDNEPLTFTITQPPQNGTLTGTPPNLVYTPNFAATTDSFFYSVTDATGPAITGLQARILIRETNIAPTLVSNAVTTLEDTPTNITVLPFGTCPNGSFCVVAFDPDFVNGNPQPLTFSIITPPTRGVLTGVLNDPNGGNGNLLYTPNVDDNGADSFVVRVTDGALSATTTVAINITPQNDVPVAQAQERTVDEDNELAIALGAADVEDTIDQLTFTITQQPAFGTLVQTGRNVVYRPNVNANADVTGADNFQFTATDRNGAVSTAANVVVTVRPINDAPVALDGSIDSPEDTAAFIDLSNDTAQNGPVVASDVETGRAQLTYTVVAPPTRGVLQGAAPNLVYVPDRDVTGTDSFTFRVSDGQLQSAVRTFTINVTPVNDAPVPEPFDFATDEDTARTFTLTSRDVDANQQAFTIFGAGTATLNATAADQTVRTANGTLTVVSLATSVATVNRVDIRTSTLTLRYLPDLDFNGFDGFVYTTGDGVIAAANLNPVPVNITINAVNDRPTVQNLTTTTAEDTPLQLGALLNPLINDVDAADSLSFTVTDPPNGTLDGAAPILTYTPDLDFFGTDSFTLTVSDGRLSASATITINVTAVNDIPVANFLALTINEDQQPLLTLSTFDPDPETVTFNVPARSATGTLTRISTARRETVFRYTPDLDTNGVDTFNFTVTDAANNTSFPATVTITVNPVNDRPLAFDRLLTTDEDTARAIDLTAFADAPTNLLPFVNDVETDNLALTYRVIRGPTRGTLTGTPPLLTYTPNVNTNRIQPCAPAATCLDSFEITVSDAGLTSAPATITIDVNPVNDAPVGVAQRLRTSEETARAIVLTGSDVDVGDQLTFNVVDRVTGANLTLPLNLTNGRLEGTPPNLTYTPFPDRTGDNLDTFSFAITDNSAINPARATSVPVEVILDVTAVNDPPVVANGSASTNEDTAINPITLTATDVDSAFVTFRIVTPPTRGRLVAGPPAQGLAGQFVYIPNPDAFGADSFTFVANDGRAESQPGTFNITINPTNDGPVAGNLDLNIDEDTPVTFTLPAFDVDGDVLTFAPDTTSLGVLSGTGATRTYTPNRNASGTESFSFTVTDPSNLTSRGRVTIAIRPLNDPPVAQSTTQNPVEDTVFTVDLRPLVTDDDNATSELVFTIVTPPTRGTISGAPPQFTYTPNADLNRTTGAASNVACNAIPCLDAITYRVTDPTGLSSTATLSLDVTATNDLPVAGVNEQVLRITLVTDGTPATSTIDLDGLDIDGNGSLQTAFDGARALAFDFNPATTNTVDAPTPQGPVTAVSLSGRTLSVTVSAEGETTYAFALFDGGGRSVTNGSLRVIARVGNTRPVVASPTTTLADVDEDSGGTTPSATTVSALLSNIAFQIGASDAEGDALVFSVATQGRFGRAAVTADGRLTFSPTPSIALNQELAASSAAGNNPAFFDDQFRVRVSDGDLFAADDIVVTVRIVDVAHDPVTRATFASTNEDNAVTITLDATDRDGNLVNAAGTAGTLLFGTCATTAQHGTVAAFASDCSTQLNGDCTTVARPVRVRFTPDVNFNGQACFTYRLLDRTGRPVAINQAAAIAQFREVNVAVAAVNDQPTVNAAALAAAAVTTEDTALELDLSTFFADIENASTTLGYTLQQGASNGTATITGTRLRYEPRANFAGTDAITVRASDGELFVDAPVTLVVNAVNDAPTTSDVAVTTNEDTFRDVTIVASDVDNNALRFRVQGATAQLSAASVADVGTSVRGSFGAIALRSFVSVSNTVNNVTTRTTTIGLRYTPDLNRNGSETFPFVVDDGTALANATASGTLGVVVLPVNDRPHVFDNVTSEAVRGAAVTTDEDTAVIVDLAAGAPRDVETANTALTYEIITQPTRGVLVLDANGGGGTNNGRFRYTPNANVNGSDAFTFKVSDGNLESDNTGTASITINPVNDAPTTTNVSATLDEDTSTEVTVVGVDIDNATLAFELRNGAGGATSNVTAVNQTFATTKGTVTVVAIASKSVTLRYAPSLNQNGADALVVRVSDGSLTADAAVSLSITPVNDRPVAASATVNTNEDTAIAINVANSNVLVAPVLFADVETANASLLYDVVRQPTRGTLSGTLPNLVYTPNPNTNRLQPCASASCLDSFEVSASDGSLPTASNAVITIDVAPVNDVPTANARRVATNEDTGINITLTGDDVDTGDAAALVFTITRQPTKGTLTGTPPNVRYTPNANESALNVAFDSFAFTVTDPGTLASPALTSAAAEVTIDVNPVDDPPVGGNQTVSVNEDAFVDLVLATDVDSTLTTLVDAQPLHGTLTIAGASVRYTPDADYNGPDSFVARVRDATTTIGPFTIALTVNRVNDAPVAGVLTTEVDEDGTLNLVLPASDIDGDALTFDAPLPCTGTTATLSGSLSSGTGAARTYTPDADFNGDVCFTFTVTDAANVTRTGIVNITVKPVNDAPVFDPLALSTDEDTVVTTTLLATDVDGDAIDYSVTGPPARGVATVVGDELRYVPDANDNGTVTLVVTADDGTDTVNAVVTIAIAPVDDAPVFGGAAASTNEDTPVDIALVATDIDSATLTFTVVGNGSLGTATVVNTTGGATLHYVPNANVSGDDTIVVEVSDGTLAVRGNVQIAIAAVDDPPLATGSDVTTPEDTAVTLTLGGSDVDTSTLTFTRVSGPAHGTLTGDGATRVYLPAPDYVGDDAITFTVGDGTTTSAEATITIHVTPVNDAPIVSVPATANANVRRPASIPVTASDVDGDALTFTVAGLSGARVEGGNVVFTPDLANVGTLRLTVTVSDGTLQASASVDVTVRADDSDGDGIPDARESDLGLDSDSNDSDGDTIADNVEFGTGAAPVDTDGDRTIDALDDDSDGDGVPDADEAGDADLSTAPIDTDGDDVPDFLDSDSDDDTIDDGADNCRLLANTDQADNDRDGIGNVCDDTPGAVDDGGGDDGGGDETPPSTGCFGSQAPIAERVPLVALLALLALLRVRRRR